jgi:spore coat polysaccharide biosynthesis protein SpsF
MNNTSIILQVRLASTRLPGKLLLPLCGISMFEHILMRLRRAKYPSSIIVAAPGNTEDAVKDLVEQYGALLFIGSEEDVLRRFVEAAHAHDVHTIVRATGDNPLVSIDYLDRAVELHEYEHADLTLFPSLPYGAGVEVIRTAVLDEAHRVSRDPFEREHITQYIYRHESKYRLIRGTPGPEMNRPDIRVTVDTDEDYQNMCRIYEALYRNSPIRLLDVITYLDDGEHR